VVVVQVVLVLVLVLVVVVAIVGVIKLIICLLEIVFALISASTSASVCIICGILIMAAAPLPIPPKKIIICGFAFWAFSPALHLHERLLQRYSIRMGQCIRAKAATLQKM
jgi:hypothetical protein